VRLDEDFVDDLDADGFGSCADSFEEAGECEVSGSAEDAVGGADDEGDGLGGEDVMAETCFVELVEDEGFHVVGIELEEGCGEGYSGLDVVVDFERHLSEEN